ncbi:MAG: DUF357 domain-containing protein [Candidatus Aenigmatarchaeota archaeon]|nr:MAG: DUF357 domain-containing protein [Candidatus Aenigmarchaeota archaeon]
MPSTEEQLKTEIKKWTARLDDSLMNTRGTTQKGVEFLTNVKAYQEDSLHFMERGDLVRAFEALLWAWAYLSIAKELEMVMEK